MSEYCDDFKEEMIAYFLVTNGVCTLDDVYYKYTLSDILKLQEMLSLKSELEG
jgi:hypothetical protein